MGYITEVPTSLTGPSLVAGGALLLTLVALPAAAAGNSTAARSASAVAPAPVLPPSILPSGIASLIPTAIPSLPLPGGSASPQPGTGSDSLGFLPFGRYRDDGLSGGTPPQLGAPAARYTLPAPQAIDTNGSSVKHYPVAPTPPATHAPPEAALIPPQPAHAGFPVFTVGLALLALLGVGAAIASAGRRLR